MGLFSKFKEVFKKEKKEDLEVYEKGLEKTRKEFVSEINVLGHKFHKVTDEYFEELESVLIKADIGIKTVEDFLERLKKRVKDENITDPEFLKEVIIDELFMIYVEGDTLTDKINIQEEGSTVILMVGVNGVGKTTTIGKLANKYHKEGKTVMLIAGDTFRAGAVPQLEEWANRTDSLFVGKENADPASVIYDGLQKALEEKVDIVLIDTAGRLQNKVNLMNELEKINKVIGKFIPNAPHETLLIIDATTGQNGISQAESFKEITNITGIVLTKLDGTAKGGIVLAIKEEVNLPVKFIGLGEKVDYYTNLFDYYCNLLSSKEIEYFKDYYFENLSLQEIADNHNVSRNAISKSLKTTKEKLDYYESNLKLSSKKNKIKKLLSEEDYLKIEKYI